ncbi:hypothetical protein B0F88_10510 [Methylobacter tundripaludum]|uniref:HTH cro/C1-type domain-containing protein n=1 Tax=Methylobacter tundripaludum TaxID=173365 RepID=A0A2S6H338_9GAMM|nr:hypothetical protein [Methylobacter tundripaludum]PPK71898.1 hypothetical protein B0F88_10510 [Methylobacter tundripaludum]
MKTVLEYLDDLKAKTGSDYRSAKLLNIEKSSISMIRSRGKMSDETAIKMADLLGIDRNEVVIAATIARSEGEVKKTWENISKLSGIAASVAIACILTGNEVESADFDNINNNQHVIHYAKSLTVTWDAKNSVSNFNIKCL